MRISPAARPILDRLGVPRELGAMATGATWHATRGEMLATTSPIDGATLATFSLAGGDDVSAAVLSAAATFPTLRDTPAPRRGEFVRRIGERLRAHKTDLAELITLEVGKIGQEALGEVQEMIDMCDFAVGQSRQLHGLTIASERPNHRMAEVWHPLGPVGVITAFNFPSAVWSWNAMLALVCGDPVIWKPSEQAPLTAVACHNIAVDAARESGLPAEILSLVLGGAAAGQALAESRRVPLISATGSTAMGRKVAETVAARLGRALLELGGNNAAIVTPSADLDIAERAILFAAVGTCGQRCTSLRRLIVHESIADELLARLLKLYTRLKIGDPRQPATLVGPLISGAALETMQSALEEARNDGVVHGGKRVTKGVPANGYYVHPAIVEITADAAIVQRETFAPILYFMRCRDLSEAIAVHNGVPQGLASSIFTTDLREAERFTSAAGSDCGIVNVNVATSGAEIGGAFGGEKDTGGGRESGSDAWKAYMRRATVTTNFGNELPLAQGIEFTV